MWASQVRPSQQAALENLVRLVPAINEAAYWQLAVHIPGAEPVASVYLDGGSRHWPDGRGQEGAANGLGLRSSHVSEPIVINDTRADIEYASGVASACPSAQSACAIPIRTQGGVNGILSVYHDQPERFPPKVVEHLLHLSSLIGAHLDTQMTLHESERLADERDALAEIGRAVSRSVSVEDAYSQFVVQMRRILPFDRVTIAVIDRENWTHRIAHEAGQTVQEWTPGYVHSLTDIIAERMARERVGVLLGQADLQSLAEIAPSLREVTAEGFRSAVSAPMIWDGEVIGLVTFLSLRPTVFEQRDLRLVERAAAQITGAVVNSELHERLEQEHFETSVIAEISRLASSSLHLDEVFQRIASQIQRLIPFDRFVLASIDSNSREATRMYVVGQRVPGWEVGLRHPLGSLIQAALHRRMPIVLQEGRVYPDLGPTPFVDKATHHGLKSGLAIPLIIGNEPVGALSLRAHQLDAYGDRELQVASRIGRVLAGPLANALTHSALEARTRQQSAMEKLVESFGSASSEQALLDNTLRGLPDLLSFDIFQAIFVDERERLITRFFEGEPRATSAAWGLSSGNAPLSREIDWTAVSETALHTG